MSKEYTVCKLDVPEESLVRYYAGTYTISPKTLHWNTGAGYRDDPAYVVAEDTLYSIYCGSGKPDATAVTGNKAMSQLTGKVGRVLGASGSYSQSSDVGEITSHDVIQYERRVSSADSSMGGVGSANTQSVVRYSTAIVDGVADYRYLNPIGGVSYTVGGEFSAVPKPGHVFLRWEVDGDKVTSTDPSDPVHVSASNPGELHISAADENDYEDVVAYFAPSFHVKIYKNADNGEYAPGYSNAGRTFSVVAEEGVATPLPAASDMLIAPTGKVFDGWNTKADGTGTPFADEGDLSALADEPRFNIGGMNDVVQLYAQWRDLTITTSVDLPQGAEQQPPMPISVTSVPAPVGNLYSEGAEVTATATTENLAGIRFSKWRTTPANIASSEQKENPTLVFSMPDESVSLVAEYVDATCQFSAEIDGDSLVAVEEGAQATITDTQGSAVTSPMKSGTAIVFHAPLPKTNNYSFDGWYEDGTLYSTQLNFTWLLSDDMHPTARYKAKITVAKDADGGDGYFLIDGMQYSQDSVSDFKTLGSNVVLSAGATSGHFNGWKKDGSSTTLPQTATVKMEDVCSYTALFSNESTSFVVTCSSVRSGDEEGVLGSVSVSGDGVTPGSTSGTYVVDGYRTVKVLCTMAAGVSALPFLRLLKDEVVIQNVRRGEGFASANVEISDDTSITAVWGNKTECTITVSAFPYGKSYGAVGFDGGNLAPTDSKTVDTGDSVTVVAKPYSGYRFAGWYVGDDKVFSATKYAFEANSNKNLVGRFEPDENAIYEWEGSDENKEMTWTSKTYVSRKPFDPVAARVDAAGYPVDLSVRTFSSPDKADALPARDHALVSPTPIRSQDGRRLQRMRPERYLRLTVRSRHEVDAVVVGTNMVEVN